MDVKCDEEEIITVLCMQHFNDIFLMLVFFRFQQNVTNYYHWDCYYYKTTESKYTSSYIQIKVRNIQNDNIIKKKIRELNLFWDKTILKFVCCNYKKTQYNNNNS